MCISPHRADLRNLKLRVDSGPLPNMVLVVEGPLVLLLESLVVLFCPPQSE